ncbi:MAG: DinB family protein [Bacillota bacterium]|nr:DinB family protein [Bacillota bacterium]
MGLLLHGMKNAQQTQLKQALHIGLDECLSALEESLSGLTDEQARAFPLPGRNNVAWIAMHCLNCLDDLAVGAQTGHRLRPPDERWVLWQCPAERRPKPGDAFPAVGDLVSYLQEIRDTGLRALDAMGEPALTRSVPGWSGKWTHADLLVRAGMHTAAHVRQIWLLRGLLGALPDGAWPRQHWW